MSVYSFLSHVLLNYTLIINISLYCNFHLQTLIRGKVGDSTVIVNKKGPTVLTILREPKNTPMQADKYTTIEVNAIRYLEN